MMSSYDEKSLFRIIMNGKYVENNCFEWQGPTDKNNYGITSYTLNKVKKTMKVHRLIYILLKGKIPDKMLICHHCDNPKCFNIDHLFCGFHSENSQDRERKGRSRNQLGENNNCCKLNKEIVLKIRNDYSNKIRICDLSRKYNIRNECISKIVHRRRWKHI
jgi:hypothetical protein